MKLKLNTTNALVLSSVPASLFHFTWWHPWLTIFCLLIWISLLALPQERLQKIPRLLISSFALVLFLSVFLTFGLNFSLDFCIAALATLLIIKPLEFRSRRDADVILIIALFYNFISIFYFTSLFETIYLFISIIFVLSIFNIIEEDKKLLSALKLVGRISLQSLPLLFLLFFVFPRVHVNLWGFTQSNRGRTGFDDHFSINDIQKLTLNNDPAFRVEFEGEMPLPEQRYWRGIVFEEFDGQFWKHSGIRRLRNYQPVAKQMVSYKIIMEPHDRRWLFVLDLPVFWKGRQPILRDHTIRRRYPVTEAYFYEVTSAINPQQLREVSNLPHTLSLPRGYNPRTIEMARTWRAQAKDSGEVLNKALEYFQNNFKYSLEPPALGRNAIDDFLFESRIGYCEHFASSFAVLMRAAGIPSRIVGGYLGGEENKIGNYLIVRQSDAHVWVEVWTGKKWLRVDPTAVVAPARLTEGLRGAVEEEDLPFLQAELRLGRIYQYWKQLYMRVDALNFAWSTWVESYTQSRQIGLFKNLGIDLQKKANVVLMIIMFCLFLVLFSLLLIWLIARQSRVRRDRVAISYERLLSKISKAGYDKPGYMGAHQLSNQLKKHQEIYTPELAELLQIYQRLRFIRLSPESKTELLDKFEDGVQKLHIR